VGRFFFAAGHTYIAGFDRPMVVGLAKIRDAVAKEGFAVRDVFECEARPRLPFRTPGRCPDDWDYVAVVERVGPSRSFDVPDRVHWIVDSTPIPALPPAPSPQPAPVSVAIVPASAASGQATPNPATRRSPWLWFGLGAAAGAISGAVVARWI